MKVFCLEEEKALIRANARAAGLSVSAFLRIVGQGYRVTGIVDFEHMKELARINGDLARLGGLLKLWLTDDPRLKQFGKSHILSLLGKIDERSLELVQVAQRIGSYKGRSNLPENLAAKSEVPRDDK